MIEYAIGDLPPRIAAKIRVNPDSGCWEWQGHRKPKGYGQTVRRDANGKPKSHYVHRLAYELLVGPIPDGLVLDHVKARGCISRACCLPAHLEPVTDRENNERDQTPRAINAAKTHCHKGHEFDLLNTRWRTSGRRSCRACEREREQSRVPRRRRRKA